MSTHSGEPWRVEVPEPTDLVLPWAHAEPPSPQDAAQALARALGRRVVLDEIEAPSPEMRWAALSSEGFPTPLAVWIEPASSEVDADVGGAAPAPWIIGVETALDAETPAMTLGALLRLLIDAWPDTPAILDVNTGRWHLRASLVEPARLSAPAQLLWVTCAVPWAEGPAGSVRLQTRGLRRCARPELEMRGVPAASAHAAAQLLDEIVELLLDEPEWPAPGVPYPIGPELEIVLRRSRARPSPGGLDRGTRGTHDLECAVVCDGRSEGWPEGAVQRLVSGQAILYRSSARSHRVAHAARAQWALLERAIERFPVFIEAELPGLGAEGEHDVPRWFKARTLKGDVATGCMVGTASDGRDRERTHTIHRDQVTDWRVEAGGGTIAAESAAALAAMLA